MMAKFEDIVCSLEATLTQATFVQQEVTENFFDKWQPRKEAEHRLYVAHEFERYSTFANIVGEKLYAMEKEIEELKKLVSIKSTDEASKATAHEKEFQSV